MKWRVKAMAAALALPWLVTATSAQVQPPCTQSVPLSVLEISSGSVLTELHAADFRISLGGAPVTVLSAERDFGTRNVVFILDVNDQIASSPMNWDMESGALRLLLGGIRKKHRIGMIAFNKKGMRQISFDSGRKGILDWLATVDADRGQLDSVPYKVGVLDAIHSAVGMLPLDGFDSTIVTVGPDEPYRSHASWEVVGRELTQRGIRVFAVYPAVMAGGSGGESASGISRVTGGLSFAFPDMAVSDVPLNFLPNYGYGYYIDRLILGEVLAPLRLELRLDSVPPARSKWKVEVLNRKNGKKRGDVYVVFPYQIPYCRQLQPAP